MQKNYNGLYVGEYSVSQGCGHIETLEQAIKNNKNVILNKTGADYLVVAVGISFDEVAIVLDEFRKKIEGNKK